MLAKLAWLYGNLSKWNKLALWLLVAAIPLAVLGYHFARPLYRSFKQANAMRMAERFIEEGDMASASMSFRRAIRSNPRNPEVWKRIATFLEGSGAAETIEVYEQLAALEPDVPEHRFKVVEAAIPARRFSSAQRALAAVPEFAITTPRFLSLSASLDLARGEFDSARKNLEKLAELGELDEQATFQLKLVELHSGTIEDRIAASTWFENLARTDSDQAVQALRELIGYQIRSGNILDANRLAARLVEHPDARLQDRLSHVELELASGSFTIPNTLQNIRARAEERPEEFGPIAMFLARKLGPDPVAAWIDALPENLRAADYVRATRLELALAAGDDSQALDMLVSGQAGVQIPGETSQLAATAIAEFKSGQRDAETAWTQAVSAAGGAPEALAILAGVAAAAQWPEAQTKALWALVARAPQHRESWLKLAILERAQGNSAGLLQALDGLARANPDDLAIRNDATLVRILLRRGDPDTMVSQAKTLVDADSGNPVFLTTYATALANAGRTDEALEVIGRLPQSELTQRNRALYIGHIYARGGNREAAVEFLDRAQVGAANLIPEERLLLTQSMNLATGRTASAEETFQQVVRTDRTDEDRQRVEDEMRRQREAMLARPGGDDILDSIRGQTRTQTDEEIQQLLDEVRGTNRPGDENP